MSDTTLAEARASAPVDLSRTGSPAVDRAAVEATLSRAPSRIDGFQSVLEAGRQQLEEAFRSGTPVRDLLSARAQLIDDLLVRVWRDHTGGGESHLALVAVGGYGRGELHPGSDVDIMVLVEDDGPGRWSERIEAFIGALWDMRIAVGHSCRTVADCEREADADVTVLTNLTEVRLLAGSPELFERMRATVSPDRMWSDKAFFEAKYAEQQSRHVKYHDTAYQLEPNVKESPGGLRDIQMIGWVTKRHFRADSLYELVTHDFLTVEEYQSLDAGRQFLWAVRFALHMLTRRAEDRLLFDHQIQLAELFGYSGDDHNLAVEQFMQRYYRTITRLSRLNELLLQLFRETIVTPDYGEAPEPINARFQQRGGFIEAADEGVFRRQPHALLEIFLLLAEDPGLQGVRAATIRLIRRDRELIDEDFRNDIRARSLFMEILRQPRGITHELRRMNRYGILARYIPVLRRVVGRMQFDLFHVYTVDQHLLFVVRNLRRMALPEFAHEYPLCSRIMQQIPKPELLYIAGLFHDIGKGRGGDHSELGAEDARRFCLRHDLPVYDARLVVWLIRNHLLMSTTAQRQDISDPEIIHEFATEVQTESRLEHLFLLTVADMRGTNPELLNSWKFTLLSELYEATRTALQRGLENPMDVTEAIEENQSRALELLTEQGWPAGGVQRLWRSFPDEYFLRHQDGEIAWETRQILAAEDSEGPLVRVHKGEARGGTTVFIYMPDRDYLFGLTTAVLTRLGLTVQDARINSTADGYALDTYVVLEENGEPLADSRRADEIRQALVQALTAPDESTFRVSRRTPRQLKAFRTPTQVEFSDQGTSQRTALELIAPDHPGLLSRVGQVFQAHGIRLHTAKIATMGERAEDVFFITDETGGPLDEAGKVDLRDALKSSLDEWLDR